MCKFCASKLGIIMRCYLVLLCQIRKIITKCHFFPLFLYICKLHFTTTLKLKNTTPKQKKSYSDSK